MNVIIANSLDTKNYRNFSIRKEFSNISSELEKIETLVLHNTVENELEVGLVLSDAKKAGVKKFIYINKKPIEIISACIKALGGITLQEEELLQEDMLDYLIESYEDFRIDTGLDITNSVDIIDDFIKRFVDKDNRINNLDYQERVKTALIEIREKTSKTEHALNKISESAVDLFNDMSRALEDYQRTRVMMEEKVYELETKFKEAPISTQKDQGVFYYPEVKYMGVNNILYIKEFAECRFLLSFILAYQNYVESFKRKRAKVVVLSHAFRDTKLRYNSAVSIDSGSIQHESLLIEKFLAVYQPKDRILNKVLNTATEDIIIVLDRMYCDEMLSGSCVRKLYATSGVEAMKRANAPVNKCILSGVSIDKLFMSIPMIENYPTDGMARLQAYFQTCKEQYKKIDNLLGI